MRYLPKLIPEAHRVLPDYFKGSISKTSHNNSPLTALYWVFGILFLLVAITYANHPLLLLLYGSIGLILLPWSAAKIERSLRFSLLPKVRVALIAPFLLFSFLLTGYYQKVDAKQALVLAAKKEADEKARLLEEQRETKRKDSVYYCVQAATGFQEKKKFDQAFDMLAHAFTFSPDSSELSLIEQRKLDLTSQKATFLLEKGAFKEAIPELTKLLAVAPTNTQVLYGRALCYSKTGFVKEAVEDLKLPLQEGNEKAEKLHNKINPIQRRITGYRTLCCDGTTSYSTGRGTCSHHGGVCNWNEPIYEEYRKYE